jgi:hypothetical protein
MASFPQGRFKGRKSPPWFLPLRRHPPPTTAGLFLPATPPLRPARGPAPKRPQAASPIFRAALVQTSASLRPFHSPPRSVARVGIPLSLHLLPPAFARWRSAFG